MTGFAVLLTVIAGLAGSVQVAVMGRFGGRIGVLEALTFATAIQLVLSLLILLVARTGVGGIGGAFRSPAWMWLGGLMGLTVVLSITFAQPRIGATATIGILIAGQLVMGALIDRYGLFGVVQIAITTPRVIGILLPGANAILFFAERNVPTGLASLIIASVPLWLAVMRLAGGERLPWQVLAGVGVGFAGVAVLAQPSGGAEWWGILLCVCSAVMWSTGSFLSSRITLPVNPLAATSWEMLAGGLLMFLPSLFTIHGGIHPSTQSIAGWIYLVTFGSIVGYTAYVWLLANAPLGLVSTYAYVNPVVAITLGVIFLNESLT